MGVAAIDTAAAGDHRPGQFEHHPDIRIELFAAEPDVVDPVSLCFAANGDCYVVEMRDYPLGVGRQRQPGGTIRLLRDTDGDGRADVAKLFAEGLSFPTSVMAWRDGVLVVAPPELLFLRDTDGDDRADDQQVMLSGLQRGVTDSNANSLRWGLDNQIHVANGGNGGRVSLPGGDAAPIALGRSDFALDPGFDELTRTARTGGGFGLVFDDFGNSFTTYNINYLQQRIMPLQYLERSPEMYSFPATENISDHGESARIYPVVQAVTRVNHPEQAGHFSSAGGMGYLQQGYFSPRLVNSIFVCDVVCNIVHRDRLREQGPVFAGGRAEEEQDCEFIASHDPACRLIGLEHGPDGALYLLDMQRDVIEHPDYIPAPVRAKLDIRGGEDRGRIYRVLPEQGLPQLPPDSQRLDLAAAESLARALAAPTRWHRETAHRLLVERGGSEVAAAVRRWGWGSESAEARARSLWILDFCAALQDADLLAGLVDADPGVRENAVRLAEQRRAEPVLLEALVAAVDDPHPRVRFRAALALDGCTTPPKFDALCGLLLRDFEYRWSRRAALLSIDADAGRLLRHLWDAPPFRDLPEPALQSEILREVADVAAATAGDQAALAAWLQGLRPEQADQAWFHGLVAGLHAGWQRRSEGRLSGSQVTEILTTWADGPLAGSEAQLFDWAALYGVAPPSNLQAALSRARRDAADVTFEIAPRLDAIRLLARARDDQSYELLIGLLAAGEPTLVQAAAVAAVGQMGREDTGGRILQRWSEILPAVRGDVIDLLLGRREYHDAMITALETGEVLFRELNLDLEQRRRLLRWSSPEIGRRAAALFGDQEYSNRKAIVADWLAQLPPDGDPTVGQQVFVKHCATCHIAHGLGHRVGPDLQALSHRSVEDLLTHILDPNMAINPNYVSCVVETADGRLISGLLRDESGESVTIVQADDKRTTIKRDDIVQWKILETSLMPEGLEKELTPPQLRALIAFLQRR